MGFLLSVHGIGPAAKKARAVTESAASEDRRQPIISPAETRQHKFAIRERTFIHGRHAHRAVRCSSSRPQGSVSCRSRAHRHPTATEDQQLGPTPPKHTRHQHEFTFIGQLIVRGARIAMPSSLRSEVLQIAHGGHLGMVKVKTRLLEKVWWLSIDKDVETTCRTCICCQVVGPPPAPQPPVQRTPFPSPPWSELAVDIFGPLPSGESTFAPVYF